MTVTAIDKRVRRILAEQFGLSADEVNNDDARLIDDIGADSLDAVELIIAVQEEFGIEIDYGEELIREFMDMTIGDAIRFVKSRVWGIPA